jgi:hypothetical protein
MPTHYPVPSADALQEVLHAMVGTDVKVVIERQPEVDDDAPSVLAEFICDSDTVGALCRVDHRSAISLGSALVGVVPEAAQEAIEGYRLDDDAIENVREVANVLAQLFNTDFTPHLRFNVLHRQPGKLPENAQDLRRRPLATRHYKVSVDRYSTGVMSFFFG